MDQQKEQQRDSGQRFRDVTARLRRIFSFCVGFQLVCAVMLVFFQVPVVVFLLGGLLGLGLLYRTVIDFLRHEKTSSLSEVSMQHVLLSFAHELQTPASAVFAYLDLMQRGNSWMQLAELVRNAKVAVQQVKDVSQNIVAVANSPARRLSLQLVEIDLRVLLSDVESMIRVLAERKKLDFYININPNVPKVVRTDALRLKQILLGLLSNAVTSTPQGVVNFDVSASTNDEGVRLEFSVQDTGPGLSQEQIQSLHPSTATARAPVLVGGWDLFTCKCLVALLEGELDYRAKQPTGGEFQLRVPMACVQSENVVSKPKSQAEWMDEIPLRGCRILLAEDTAMLRDITSRCLERLGAEVVCVLNGLEAREAVLNPANQYDLVLMDVQMPEMDGLEATRQIRSRWADRDLPIVALSAYTSWHEIKQSLDAGMNAHFQKPLKVDDVVAFLRSFTNQSPDAFQTSDWLAFLDPHQGLSNFSGDKHIYLNALSLFRNQLDSKNGAMASVNWEDASGVISYLHRLKSMALTTGALQMGWLADQMHYHALRSTLDESAELSLQACIQGTRNALDEFLSANALGVSNEVADSR